jgi:hypothetical protein
MYPRVKYQLADGHDNEAAGRTEAPAMHATVAAEEADQASPENAATAASATASGLAAAVGA